MSICMCLIPSLSVALPLVSAQCSRAAWPRPGPLGVWGASGSKTQFAGS